jgi:hypothetical protein
MRDPFLIRHSDASRDPGRHPTKPGKPVLINELDSGVRRNDGNSEVWRWN